MLTLPTLEIGSRVTLVGPSLQATTYLIDGFDSDGHPLGRARFLGTWGPSWRLPLDVEGITLAAVHPPAPLQLTPAERITRARASLREHYVYLSGLPHPKANREARGESLADYLTFCLACAGPDGKLKACATLEAALLDR
jgi:hypothetical protein